MKHYYLILNSFVAMAMIILAIIVFLDDSKNKKNRLFFLFSVFASIWVVACYVSNDTNNPPLISLYGNYIVFMFSYFTSYFLLELTRELIGINKKRSIILTTFIILTGIISASPLVVAGVEPQENVYAVKFGPLVAVYALLLFAMLAAVEVHLYRALKLISNKKEKNKISTTFWSISITIPVLIITQFVAPALTGSFEITDIGIMIMLVPVLGFYISVFKRRLFDVRQATMRTVGYALTVVTMAGIYVGLAYATSLIFFKGQIVQGISFSPLNVALALILVFIFQPIKRFFDRITNKIFYRNEYDREVFFKEFGKILSHDTDLKLLLRQTGAYIKTNLKAESVFFYLIGHGVYNGREQKPKIEREDIWQIIDYHNQSSLYRESLALDFISDEKVKLIFEKYKINLALPILSQKNIVGFLFLGEHKSRGYSRRDVTTLEAIINELSIAIQNSLSVEEVRDLNETLQQRIKDATKELRLRNRQLKQLDEVKDEFLSIASHQLRTPLTSVKGYVDMLLEGDFGKLQPKQRDILEDVFMSSERMVQLINDFLNVSRIQTGKFVIERQISSLVDLVSKEIGLLVSQLEQKQLKIDWHFDETIEDFAFDEAKIRQVVINMLDNAIYYSKPDSNIKVALDRVGDKVKFTVVDTGIGVPTDEQDRLFSKFFRASNARQRRPDGTGVGLYLAKKIVDAHGGRIIFKSIEGKGSTFGFELPAK